MAEVREQDHKITKCTVVSILSIHLSIFSIQQSMLIANSTHDKQGIKLITQFNRNNYVDIIQAYNKA